MMAEMRADSLMSAAGQFRSDHALAHDEDAVADLSELLGVARRDDHGRAVLGRLHEQLVDLRLGAGVDTLRRLVHEDDPRPRAQPFGEHDLLLVSAAEEIEGLFDLPARNDAQPGHPGMGLVALAGAIEAAPGMAEVLHPRESEDSRGR